MVWLVWREYRMRGQRALIGAWSSLEDAQTQCRDESVTLAHGSGQITESMVGDEWEIFNNDGKMLNLVIREQPYGVIHD